ncbi:hypothetical protein G8A07_25540 [Roseateles sp. DAIF2]|uniref:hypothetical protein n=1 Tax=Roseateles sp. DAIF2 TaxID=2714952 RepID=UPI0018A2F687|nr:hypothetical protein [Roseateles sp. DAIF2]QPF75950.1 hypothetical protein G8A07_25540 [Roseateles sp. DAIF2]
MACWLAWRILRSPGPLWLRLLNAAVAFIPFIGPLFAFWASDFPAPHHPAYRDNSRYSPDVYLRWIDVLRMRNESARQQRWKELMKKNHEEEP